MSDTRTTLDTVRRVVAEQLNAPIEAVVHDSTYESVPNWDSLGTMRIALAVEEEFGVSFSTQELLAITSVRGIVEMLEHKRGAA